MQEVCRAFHASSSTQLTGRTLADVEFARQHLSILLVVGTFVPCLNDIFSLIPVVYKYRLVFKCWVLESVSVTTLIEIGGRRAWQDAAAKKEEVVGHRGKLRS